MVAGDRAALVTALPLLLSTHCACWATRLTWPCCTVLVPQAGRQGLRLVVPSTASLALRLPLSGAQSGSASPSPGLRGGVWGVTLDLGSLGRRGRGREQAVSRKASRSAPTWLTRLTREHAVQGRPQLVRRSGRECCPGSRPGPSLLPALQSDG